jgi:centromere/kinetochore protein ZW10
MCHLYRILVKSYHKIQLEQIPYLSMIFFNDCMYISYWVLQYTKQFTSENEYKDLEDVTELLQATGLDVYKKQLTSQREGIRHLINQMNGLRNIGKTQFSNINVAIEQINDQLERLRQVWSDALPPSFYRTTLGSIIEFILSEMIKMVLEIDDISDKDSGYLNTFFGTIVLKVNRIFENATEKQLNEAIPSFERFKAVCNIMDMKLVDITREYTAFTNENIPAAVRKTKKNLRENTICDQHCLKALTKSEIIKLICSLFEDTPKRQQAIEAINDFST